MTPAKRPRIVFYINPKLWPQGTIPSAPGISWTGYRFGSYCWSVQTVLYLQQAGYECELSSELPEDGIVLAHSADCTFGGTRLLPGRRRLLVAMVADYDPYPSANIQVVQNPVQAFWYKNSYYIMLWPEPGMKPRVPSARFRNVSFMGFASQFSSELGTEEWTREVRRLGLEWVPRIEAFQYNDPSSYRIGDGAWSDLSEIDAVVAVRKFSPYPTFDHKPPSKLINCWLAGIPAVLGAESAYRSLYKSELDYIEVHSKEEAITALTRLRDKPELRVAMIENGLKRSKEVNAHATVQRWIRFMDEVAIPSYHCWVGMSKTMQQVTLADNRISYIKSRICRKLGSL